MEELPVKRTDFFKRHWYEITQFVLGQGSFSAVYLAKHNVFKNKVALKIIDKNNIKEEYVLKNLRREANILMKLNHPNIVNFYEELSYHDFYCLSMEYVNGMDLCRYLRKQPLRKVSEEVAKLFFYQMVSAIHHMHNLNVLHRDLKQENVLVEFGRVIKIIDFGLSNVYHPTIQLRTHCGSFVYAAPELFETHSTYGAGVDLWSLGIILYSMVVGKMPFGLPKRKDKSVNDSSKLLFLQRISRGLTRENRDRMKNLSYDCCHLLINLLQPNQFARIIIKDAIVHPWFERNPNFKKRLPQPRLDLVQNFRSEIIEFMADRMKTSTEKIEHNLMAFPYSRISAVYFIAKDTLIKEVLYPPREMRRSFLFEIECRKRARLSSIAGLEDDDKEEENETISHKSGSFFTTTRDSEVDYGMEGKSAVSRTPLKKDGNSTSRRKSGGDYAKRNLPLIQPLKKVEILEKFMDSLPGTVTRNLIMKQQAEHGDGKSVSFDQSGNDPFPSHRRNRQTKLDKNNSPTTTNEKKSEDNRYSRIPEMNLNNYRNEVYPLNAMELGEKLKRVSEINSYQAKRKQHEKEHARDIMELGEKLKRVCDIGSYEVKNRHERGKETIHQSEPRSITKQRNEAMSRLIRAGQGNQYSSKLQTPDSLNHSYSRSSSRGFPTNVSLHSTSSNRQKPIKQERFLQVTNEGLGTFKQAREHMPVVPHRSSKAPISEFHFGSPASFNQKLPFGPAPTRESRSRRYN